MLKPKLAATALATLLIAAAPPPSPQATLPHPALVPSRNATLGYHLEPGLGPPFDVQVLYQAGGGVLRMDLPDQTYLLLSPAAHGVMQVVPADRTVTEIPWSAGPQSLFMLDPRMRFTRKAEATVAGERCTVWDATDGPLRRTLCVTEEGLVLRNAFQDPQGHRNLVEATSVQFAADEAAFAVPPDYEILVLQAVPQR